MMVCFIDLATNKRVEKYMPIGVFENFLRKAKYSKKIKIVSYWEVD